MVLDSNGNLGLGTTFPAHKITAITTMSTAATGLGNKDGYRFTTLVTPTAHLNHHNDAQNPFHNIAEIPSYNTHDVSTVRALFSQAINNGSQSWIYSNLEGVVGEARNNVPVNIHAYINGGFFGAWNNAGTAAFQNGVRSYNTLTSGGIVNKMAGINVTINNDGTVAHRYGVQVLATGSSGNLSDYGFYVTGFANPLFLGGLTNAPASDSVLTVSSGVVKYRSSGVSPILVTTSNVTLTAATHIVVLKTGVTSITLPAAAANPGRIYMIANSTSDACTISTYNSLSGSTSTNITANTGITLQSDGINWYQIDK